MLQIKKELRLKRVKINKTWIALLVVTVAFGCKKDSVNSNLPALTDVADPVVTAAPVAITLKVDQTQSTYNIPSNFAGLSYETGILAQTPEFLNENNAVLIQLIKNLGKGVLRIGGNTSDEINWVNGVRTSETPESLLTTTDVDHLNAFSKAIGWPVIFGLNLANSDATAAANEALYVNNSLGKGLIAFQSGNEPDVFNLKLRPKTYGYPDFKKEWDNYFVAVRKSVTDARFAGPDVDPFNPNWISDFASDEHSNIKLIDGHFYSTGPASSPAITYNDILTQNPKLDGYLVQLGKLSAQYRFPYRISECNNVFGGGKPGVSDVFASALWALDFMWDVAENKGQGINFHGGPPRFAYSPISMADGVVTARPEYYAMLAFQYANKNSKIIPATIVDPRPENNCTAYACSNADGSYSITLINKDVAKSFAFNINLTNTATSVQIARLSAPSITSATGTVFEGSAVNADGTFTPAALKAHVVSGKSFVINVPSGSAAVITVK